MRFYGEPWEPLDERARRIVEDGVDCLLRHHRANPASWQALWIAAKGLQALGDNDGAVREFAAAFAAKPDQVDVGREYALALLETGRFADAEPVARAACAAQPKEAGLVANLAVVLLLCGKTDDATATIAQALQMDPNDKI